jgi:hypothetical protein
MVWTKVTPEMLAFIEQHSGLTNVEVTTLVNKEFNTNITLRTISEHLSRIRSGKQELTKAKIDEVRSSIVSEGKRNLNQYLTIIDREIKAWDEILINGIQVFPLQKGETEPRQIFISNMKDRAAASKALQDSIGKVLDFVKPTDEGLTNNIDIDLSIYTEEELEEYGRLAAKLAGVQEGKGKAASS